MYEAIAKVVSTTRNTSWGAKGDFSFTLSPKGRAELSGSADESAFADICNLLIDAAMSLLGPLGFELVRFIEMLTVGTDIVLHNGRVAFGAGGHKDRLDVVKVLVPFCAPGTGRGLRFKGGGAPPDCVVTYPHCGAILGSAAGFNTEEFGGMPGLYHSTEAGKGTSFLMVLRVRKPPGIIDVVDHPFLGGQSISISGDAAASAAMTFDYQAASRSVLSVIWQEDNNAEVRKLAVCQDLCAATHASLQVDHMLSAMARGITHNWAGLMGRAFAAHVRSVLSTATSQQLACVLHSPAADALGCLVPTCNRQVHGAVYGRQQNPGGFGIGACNVDTFLDTFQTLAAFPGVTYQQLKNCFTNQAQSLYAALAGALVRADAVERSAGRRTVAQLRARKASADAPPGSCSLCGLLFKTDPDATKAYKPAKIFEKEHGSDTGRVAWGCCNCRAKYNNGKLLKEPRFR